MTDADDIILISELEAEIERLREALEDEMSTSDRYAIALRGISDNTSLDSHSLRNWALATLLNKPPSCES